MQPTFKKYGLKKNNENAEFGSNKKQYAAGKVWSLNVSESGGGEIKSISKSNREASHSNSPFRPNNLYTVSPGKLCSIFSSIREVNYF